MTYRIHHKYSEDRAWAGKVDKMTKEEVQMLTSEEAEALAGNCGWYGEREKQVPIPRRICGDRQVFVEKRTQHSPGCEIVVRTTTQWFPDGAYWLDVANRFVHSEGCVYCGFDRSEHYVCPGCGDC